MRIVSYKSCEILARKLHRSDALNCAAHLAKCFQNKTTYARPLFIKRSLNENVYQPIRLLLLMLYSSRLCTEVVIYSPDDIVLDSWKHT